MFEIEYFTSQEFKVVFSMCMRVNDMGFLCCRKKKKKKNIQC